MNSYNTNIIVTDFQQSIQACQTEHSYFENISRNINDCNNNIYNKLRDIQTTMNETKAVYVVVDHYHNNVVNFKDDADNIKNTINTVIYNYKFECININSINHTVDKYILDLDTIINNLSNTIKNCTSEQTSIFNEINITTRSEANAIINELNNIVQNRKSQHTLYTETANKH